MKPSEIVTAVSAALDCDFPAWIWGKPGIAKSAVTNALAKTRDALLIDVRLSMWESVDFRGIPAIIDGKTVWLKPGIWADVKDREVIVFLDEADRGRPDVQNVALQMVLDRRVGEHLFPANYRFVAAGNGSTDKVGTNKIGDALATRFMHLEMEADRAEWLKWAAANGVDPLLYAFIDYRGDDGADAAGNKADGLLITDKAPGDRTNANPRQWERVSKVLGVPDLPEAIRHQMIKGLVGTGPAGEFEAFYRTFSRMKTTVAEVLANPASAAVPMAPNENYAMTTALIGRADANNFGAIATYCQRLPREFEVSTMLAIARNRPALQSTRAWVDFGVRNQDVTL